MTTQRYKYTIKIEDIVDKILYKNPKFDSRNNYSSWIAEDIYERVIEPLIKKIDKLKGA